MLDCSSLCLWPPRNRWTCNTGFPEKNSYLGLNIHHEILIARRLSGSGGAATWRKANSFHFHHLSEMGISDELEGVLKQRTSSLE